MNATGDERSGTVATPFPSNVQNVLVIMSFGGNDVLAERRSILEFLRIKYIIENKINVFQKKSDPSSKLTFEANVYKAEVGSIPDNAIDRITGADVVVALITEKNVNVIYELAVRNVFKVEFVIIIKGNPKDVLPIYIQDIAYIPWAKQVGQGDEKQLGEQGKKIQDTIDQLAKLEERELDFNFNGDQIPQELKKAIDKYDNDLVADLQRGFEKIESFPRPKPLPFLRRFVGSLDPGQLLVGWQTYVPFSILRITWKRQSGNNKYEADDIIGEPVVYDVNEQYSNIFDFAKSDFPDPNGERPLTLSRLIEQIKDYVAPSDLENFLNDQGKVSKKIIFDNAAKFSATVPLIFNENHPFEQFRDKAFMPVLASRRRIGDPNHRHTMFLVVNMIEGPWQRAAKTGELP
jgi:hypothetical protein